MVREAKAGGIDWYRYGKEILVEKLLPWAQELQKERPKTIVQEDKAASHVHKHQATVFSQFNIERLLWPGNSPDLNIIEPTWAHLKQVTTKKGAPSKHKIADTAWRKAWKDLEQARIQRWIERIPRHTQEIIRSNGDNCYHEGR